MNTFEEYFYQCHPELVEEHLRTGFKSEEYKRLRVNCYGKWKRQARSQYDFVHPKERKNQRKAAVNSLREDADLYYSHDDY